MSPSVAANSADLQEVGPGSDAVLSAFIMERIDVDAVFDPLKSEHLFTITVLSKTCDLKCLPLEDCEDPSVLVWKTTLVKRADPGVLERRVYTKRLSGMLGYKHVVVLERMGVAAIANIREGTIPEKKTESHPALP
jgi:hypothetical protein